MKAEFFLTHAKFYIIRLTTPTGNNCNNELNVTKYLLFSYIISQHIHYKIICFIKYNTKPKTKIETENS